MLWKAFKIFGFIIGVLVAAMILAVLHNNTGDSNYSRTELNTAFEQSINWLQKNNHSIQADHNSMLWWMLIQAASIQHNEKLDAVIAQYKKNNLGAGRTEKYGSMEFYLS